MRRKLREHVTGKSISMLWRRLLSRLTSTFSWPLEPTFSNEVDAAAALFERQFDPEDADLDSTPASRSG
jgi:hypothetical protein